MRIQPTHIEQLDRKHPGLRLEVDLLLDRGGRVPGQGTLQDVQKMLAEKYGEVVARNTISNYKQKYLCIRRLIDGTKRNIQAADELYREGKVTDLRRAQFAEIVNENLREIAKDAKNSAELELRWAHQSVREKRLEQVNRKLEQDNRKLEVQIEQLKQDRDAEKAQVMKVVESDGKELNQARDELRAIYGLPPLSA